jgi:hypothetical protein
MEQTKITVRLPRHLVEGARRYAEDNNTTLTRLVAEYFRTLGAENAPLSNAPIVRRLSGILAQEASVEDYHRYLEDKYGRQAASSDRP